MTLSLVWLRSSGQNEELVIASDSRLTSPFVWDACPKILPLPRNDCALCFAGHTTVAYPFMLQIQAAVMQNSRSFDRSVDLPEFKGSVLRLINGMRGAMHTFPTPYDNSDQEETFLILAGYSWSETKFRIWTLNFDAEKSEFVFRPATLWDGVDGNRLLAVIGNHVNEAKNRIVELLDSKGKKLSGGFDMEPFEILRDMIRTNSYYEIGGPPQLVKVHRRMNSAAIPVYWPDKKSRLRTVLGRTLLDDERTDAKILNPDTLFFNPASKK